MSGSGPSTGDPLKVCLDARLKSGTGGGVESVLIGLAAGLAKLTDGDEEYLFLAWRDEDQWLRPHLGSNSRLLDAGPQPRPVASRLPPWLRKAWHAWSPLLGPAGVPIHSSDGRPEASGAQVMHFPKQDAFLTRLPSIYHPHDLQHLHLPRFFTPRERYKRETLYRRFCREASVVAVSSDWVRQDLLRQYGLDANKVACIPLAPVLKAYPEPQAEDLRRVRQKWTLPETFIFYAAQTWPHKNHLMLLEAATRVREQHGLDLAFVFSGTQTDHADVIRSRAKDLGMDSRVNFVGFVSPLELVCLYQLCRAVAIPSLFEAASFPLWEAFQLGVPAACSNVTSLPRQAGDAALVFDPLNADSIAESLWRLWSDGDLRAELRARGAANVARFGWERTARICRAHYRRLAGKGLSPDDETLLAAPALL